MLSNRAIGAQMGWSERAVEVYGHIDLIVLGEVDALYAETGCRCTLFQTQAQMHGVGFPLPNQS